MSGIRMQAWKRIDEGHLTCCDVDDPAAVQWDVHYPGAYCGMPLSFDNKSTTNMVSHALAVAFEAGKRQFKRDLRQFLGIS